MSDEAAELVAYYSSHQTNSYCNLASSVLFFYECVITFTDEVNLFWSQKLTGASALFFLNRWAIILYGAFTLVTGFMQSTISPEVTSSLGPTSFVMKAHLTRRASLVIGLLQYFPWAGTQHLPPDVTLANHKDTLLVFSALRALGVTRNWPFSILILMLSLVPLAINLSAFHFDPTGVVVPELGCVYTETMTEQTAKICKSSLMHRLLPIQVEHAPTSVVTIVSRVCLITADVLLGLATWFKLSAGGAHRGMKAGTFAHTLLMDGTIYFIALSILNTLHLILTLLSFGTEHENVSVVTDFTEPLTGVLVSRFLMDLQSANRRALNTDSSLYSSGVDGPLESIVFERVVGSLASTIPPLHAESADAQWSGSDEGTVGSPSEGDTLAIEEVRRSGGQDADDTEKF
ncbi:hypothetical protein K466DRAFT_600296 [Polyporus arcularius HHB13444]|uniref:DUF6533 domain-containing protein n=1 Tax=Polyporus arcularius HHB13444 TaxID=1314778 RepID=A0A5C3PE02_9APHY|nr:hypothetical protein K466DRAFT_600296 [Polyporus arcularius HHB13444]